MGVLLEINDLGVSFVASSGRRVDAVRGASIQVAERQWVAIVGESGSGKSTLAHAVIDLLPPGGQVTGGSIRFQGRELVGAPKRTFVALRGAKIGLVPQDPMSNLNPVYRIGAQVKEALKANNIDLRRAQMDARVTTLLQEAGLPDAERRRRQYPHEFSGGMRQRALIAMGLAARPDLLIADEPTSALDVTVQRQILDHLKTLTDELGTAVLFITHDLGLAAERAEHLVVMHKGKVVEAGPSLELLTRPRHPYTRRLVEAAPSLASRRIQQAKHEGLEPTAVLSVTAGEGVSAARDDVLQVRDVTKVFRLRGARPGSHTDFTAVDQVSLTVKRGTTAALVGESGSGKSTVANMVLSLLEPTSGEILFEGQSVAKLPPKALFEFRSRVQPVFQDPYGSLDPMWSIYRIVEEPLRVHGVGSGPEREARVRELLDKVALPASVMRRYPGELSGGQRQRVAVARALALNPQMVVLDEAVSALDVLVQAQVLELLSALQRDLGLTYLFITHDLAVVRQMADWVYVMEKGRIVEQGATDQVFEQPEQAYTRRLLEAIPGASLRLEA
jgi:peptide/nickel transport system ATP-binding protein